MTIWPKNHDYKDLTIVNFNLRYIYILQRTLKGMIYNHSMGKQYVIKEGLKVKIANGTLSRKQREIFNEAKNWFASELALEKASKK